MTVTLVATYKSGRDREFRSYSELLRWICANYPQAGHLRSPYSIYLGSLRVDGSLPGNATYTLNRMLSDWTMTAPQVVTLLTVQSRYRRYRQYLEEVLPQWRDTGTSYHMDNSVEVVQTSQWGTTRTQMRTAPHGDAC